MRRVLTAGAAAAVALTGLVGCGTSGTPAEQRAGDSILLAAPSGPEAVMDALIEGTLTRTEAGCYALEQGAQVFVLQFPYGTSLADDGESVDVPELGTLEIGDEISGGGGYLDVPDAPAECRVSTEFAVWQTASG